jgi:hypothetical protein
MAGPTGGELAGCLGIASAILIGFGVFVGWFAPIVWGWVKPWIHAVTG